MEESKTATTGFCRACLIKYEDPLDLIPYNEKNRRLFVYTTGLQVKRNDSFVFQLCKQCFSNMKMASKFKKLCRGSDKKFKTFMGLKKLGSNVDFCNFIKNADNSFMFRIPTLAGNNTSSPPKVAPDNCKDDAASTSTSIRNFMTDILREEDIPDSEAKIIKEVIAEEADILEDSLDSHWLDEDDEMSIDEDINLILSLSPFSTPKLENDERYSPLPIAVKEDKNKYNLNSAIKTKNIPNKDYSSKQEINIAVKSIKIQAKELNNMIDKPESINNNDFQSNSFGKIINMENVQSILPVKTMNIDENQCRLPVKTIHINENQSDIPGKTIHIDDYETDLPIKTIHVQGKEIDNKENHGNLGNQCAIDKNLAIALKNDSDLISLSSLLKSPAEKQMSGSTTPLIKNLLFGDSQSQSTPDYIRDLDKPISIDFDRDRFSNFDPDEILKGLNDGVTNQSNDSINISDVNDFSNDYLQNKNIQDDNCNQNVLHEDTVTKELDTYEIIILNTNDNKSTFKEKSIDSIFDLENKHCNECKKDFKSLKGLKSHAYRVHKHRMPAAERIYVKTVPRLRICDFCGKRSTDARNFIRHIKSHEPKKKDFKCEICFSVFDKVSHLRMHSYHHMAPEERDKAWEEKRKFVCSECGAKSATKATLKLHMLRHTNNYKFACLTCGKLFHRKHDLVVHERNHSGETPYPCDKCDQAFKRRDELTRHLNNHYAKYKCATCERCFPNETVYQKHLNAIKKCRSKTDLKPATKKKRIKTKIKKPKKKIHKEIISSKIETNSVKDEDGKIGINTVKDDDETYIIICE